MFGEGTEYRALEDSPTGALPADDDGGIPRSLPEGLRDRVIAVVEAQELQDVAIWRPAKLRASLATLDEEQIAAWCEAREAELPNKREADGDGEDISDAEVVPDEEQDAPKAGTAQAT